MGNLKPIEEAVLALKPEELSEFRAWFVAVDGDLWDEQIERDISAGKLDALAQEALGDLRAGRCREL